MISVSGDAVQRDEFCSAHEDAVLADAIKQDGSFLTKRERPTREPQRERA